MPSTQHGLHKHAVGQKMINGRPQGTLANHTEQTTHADVQSYGSFGINCQNTCDAKIIITCIAVLQLARLARTLSSLARTGERNSSVQRKHNAASSQQPWRDTSTKLAKPPNLDGEKYLDSRHRRHNNNNNMAPHVCKPTRAKAPKRYLALAAKTAYPQNRSSWARSKLQTASHRVFHASRITSSPC